jgi:hypothetical protein
MTTSGTTTFNLDLTDLVEEAFERAGAEMRSGYDLTYGPTLVLNLMFTDWANRGVNMWTIEQGDSSFPLLQVPLHTYLPSDTVDLIEFVVRTNALATRRTQSDLSMSRISVSTYASLSLSKLVTRTPNIQIYVDRLGKRLPLLLHLWPVPDTAQTYQFVYWRLTPYSGCRHMARTRWTCRSGSCRA